MQSTQNVTSDTATFSGPISHVGSNFQHSSVGTFNNYEASSKSSPEELYQCISALGQSDPRDTREQLITRSHKKTEGTCEWILDDQTFQMWKRGEDSKQSLLWICDGDGHGVGEGMGKTTMAIFVSQYLEESSASRNDLWVLYYFCDRQDENRNSAAAILKGLMFQLYRKHESLASIIQSDYRIQRETLFGFRSIQALWRIFRNMINNSPVEQILCVIDGVDQCHDTELKDFLMTLNGYFTRHDERQASKKADDTPSPPTNTTAQPSFTPAKVTPMRMLILSRESPQCVVEALGSFPRLTLRGSKSQNGKSDLERFTEASIDRVVAGHSGSKGSKQETEHIINRALKDGENRSFLWVNLIAEKLLGMRQSQIKQYIPQIPNNVEDFYIQTLLEVPVRQRPHVSAVLMWVALAVRPLSTLELTKAVKYTLNISFPKKILKKTLGMCHGLVRREDSQVFLVDQSVQRFLFAEQSPLRQNKELQEFVLTRSDAHSNAANTCIAYLQNSANLKTSRRVRMKPGDRLNPEDFAFLRKHAFLEYAIVNWTFHARQGNVENTNYDAPFFRDNSARRRLWWESYWISLRQSFAWKWTAPGRFSLLHLAAFFDIVPLALYVEQKGRVKDLIGSEDHQGMKPINWATERCQPEMVKFLLQRGDFDNEALRQAARTGEASIIAMLLENRQSLLHSPTITSATTSPTTPSSPFQSFRKATLSTLSDFSKKFDHTNDGNLKSVASEIRGYGDAKSETPLHIAANCGHDDAVEAFLKAGEDIYATTDGGWTALHNAAWFGRASIVDRLVAAGADGTAKTKDRLTPLHCAVKNSQPAVVESLLCKAVVDIEARDLFGLTPFHMACKCNNILIMEILLDYGASIESRLPQGWTPLLWACVYGKFAVAQVLLKRGADVKAKCVQIYSEAGKSKELGPIGLAEAYRHEGIARLVERFGALDASRLAGDELKALAPTKTNEEEYSVPIVQEIPTVEPGFAEAADVDAPGAGDSDSSAESDGDSDDGSELDDGECRTRKQSMSSIPESNRNLRQSNPELSGLCIQENGDIDEEVEDSQGGEVEAPETRNSTAREIVRAPSQDDRALHVREQSDAGQEAECCSPQEIDITEAAAPGIQEENIDEAADLVRSDQRAGNMPDSKRAASFSNRWGRFSPRGVVYRKGSAASSVRSAPAETAEENLEAADEGSHDLGVADPVPEGLSSKSDVGLIERFNPIRFLSWKDDSAIDETGVVSPRTQVLGDPLDARVETAVEARAPTQVDSDKLPITKDNSERSDSSGRSISVAQTSKPGRFSTKTFGWKNAPDKKDV